MWQQDIFGINILTSSILAKFTTDMPDAELYMYEPKSTRINVILLLFLPDFGRVIITNCTVCTGDIYIFNAFLLAKGIFYQLSLYEVKDNSLTRPMMRKCMSLDFRYSVHKPLYQLSSNLASGSLKFCL